MAAASARLCVETHYNEGYIPASKAAASARLCVETISATDVNIKTTGSRLRAAVC